MKQKICVMLACLFPIGAQAADAPETIDLPPAIRTQFFANMRDHLLAIHEIQAALGAGQFEHAADIASSRLGLKAASSAACRMKKPGMMQPRDDADNSALSKFMPKPMHKIGYKMHTAADNFAAVARSSSGDYRKAIGALSQVTEQCTACHANFRVSRQ